MLQTYFRHLADFNRDVRLFLAATFAIGIAFDGGIYTVLFNLYLLRLNYGPTFIGQVNSAGLLAFSIFAFPAGALGSRFGSRRMMLWGLGVMLIGSLTLPLAELAPFGWQGVLITCSYVLIMLGLCLYFVNSAPFLMRSAKPENRNHIFSIQSALLSFAAFLGSFTGGFLPGLFAPLLGATLDQAAPYRYPLLIAAILLIPAWFVLRATQPITNDASSFEDASSNEEASSDQGVSLPTQPFSALMVSVPIALFGVLILIRFFQVAGIATLFTFFNVYLDDGLSIPTSQIGMVTALGRLLAVPAALVTPVLTARYGNKQVVMWASYGTAICILPVVLAPHWLVAGIGFMASMALSSIRFPSFQVLTMELVSPRLRGPVAGAGETAAGFSFSVMALSGGFIIASWGYPNVFLVGAILTAIGAAIFGWYFRLPRGEMAVPVPVDGG